MMIYNAGTTLWTYDGMGRIQSITDPNNHIVSYAYNALDIQTRLIYPGQTDCLNDPDHCLEKIRGPFKTYIDPFYSSSYKREWSPDGKQIAFYQINNKNDSLADPTRPPADGIYLIPAVGGTPVRIAGSPKTRTPLFQWISVPHPFAPDAKYTITLAGNGLNLRNQPSQTGKPLKMLKQGDEITIVKGPILTDGYTWWQMRAKDGVEGWAEDLPDWYAP